MADTKDTGEKTLRVAPSKTLTIKRTSGKGTVRQSFSHGRSKEVVVETVKRRVVGPGDAKAEPAPEAPKVAPRAAPAAAEAAPAAAKSRAAKPAASSELKPSGVVLRTLTEEERTNRSKALDDARSREAEDRRSAEEDAKRRASRDAIDRAEREAAEKRKTEEETRRASEEEKKRKAELEARKRFGGEDPTKPAPRGVLTLEEDDDGPRSKHRGSKAAPPPKPARTGGEERRRGRLTVVTALSNADERQRSIASFRRRTQRMTGHRPSDEPKEKIVREVVLPETITIQELANRMAERGVDVIRLLMAQGQMLKITDAIDADTAQLVAEEMGHTVKRVSEADVVEGLFDTADDAEHLQPRPAVVTIMGHVDHGKTSLLDSIRQTDVVAGEAGGITQHIGAYQVTTKTGAKVTFIDTPGHAAFTAMRARGAKVTDLVVLVVAADDGVKPQTVEAINHARAGKVPMIVAINKIDKSDAKPERVRTELLQHEVQVESLGGETLEVEVSATKKTNLDKLLEMIALQAEILDLRANPDRAAEGTVIEAKLDRGRGPVATVLVQRGTLRVGDIVVAGAEWGRVRALVTDQGKQVETASPSMPVEVLGFAGTPEAGDRLAVVENEARAREVTDYRQRERREKSAQGMKTGGSLEQMMSQLKTAGRKEFPLLIKGDVQGSVEAIVSALEKLGTEEVMARVLHAGVGAITESDVTLAETSGAAIIGFNVRAHKEAREKAERAGNEIRYYNIIYNLVDDVKGAMSGLLAPTLRETALGKAEILEVFDVSKIGKVAGCRVTEGKVERGANVRLVRDDIVIHEGKLSTLKRFKDDAREVLAGQECGMSFESYEDIRKGDLIECYRVESIKRTL